MTEFGRAVYAGFRHYFDFRGRASRSEFWYFVLFFCLAYIFIWLIDHFFFAANDRHPRSSWGQPNACWLHRPTGEHFSPRLSTADGHTDHINHCQTLTRCWKKRLVVCAMDFPHTHSGLVLVAPMACKKIIRLKRKPLFS